MPTRRILRPWTTQPPLQYGLRARYRDGLAWSWSATREFSDSDGRLQAYSQPRGGIYYATKASRAGVCVSGSNTTIHTNAYLTPPSQSTPISIALFCDLAVVSTTTKSLMGCNIFDLRAGNGTNAYIDLRTRQVGDSSLVVRAATASPYVTGPTAIAATIVPSSHASLWIDGMEIGTSSLSADMVNFGDTVKALFSWSGLYAQAGWSRALSPAEMREITSNYWAMYEPQQIYVPRSSGAPAYTHPTLSNARMIWTGPGAGQPAIDYSW